MESKMSHLWNNHGYYPPVSSAKWLAGKPPQQMEVSFAGKIIEQAMVDFPTSHVTDYPEGALW